MTSSLFKLFLYSNVINQTALLKKNPYSKNEVLEELLFVSKLNEAAIPNKKVELTVSYVLIVLFSKKKNTRVVLLTASGKLIGSYSSGFVGLKGKEKLNRNLALRKIFLILKKSAPIITNTPISLHLHNASHSVNSIIKLASQFFLVTSVKLFDMKPYNGCRKKKLRRKKFSQQIKR